MKKTIAFTIALWLVCAGTALADSALSYDLNGTPSATDQLLGIDDPSGTWAINRFAVQTLFDLMEADLSGFSIHVDNIASGGITDNSIVEVDGSPNDDEFARFTADGIEGLTAAETRTALDVTADSVNILSIADDTWTGQTIDDAIAGEAMSTSDQWGVVYVKWDATQASPAYFMYNPDSADTDNDTYKPVGLLVTSATIAAGDTISVTSGNGILRNDTFSFTYQTDEGLALYCSDTADGAISKTAPNDPGDHYIRIGKVLSVEGGSYGDVIETNFGYVDLTVQ